MTNNVTQEDNKRTLIIVAIAAVVVVLLIGSGFFSGCNYGKSGSQKNLEACQTSAAALQTKYNQLIKKNKELKGWYETLRARNKVNRQIMATWHIVIPEDNELDTFDANSYFAENWCHWQKVKLPIVRKDYADAGFPSCNPVSVPASTQNRGHRETPRRPRPTEEYRPIPGPTNEGEELPAYPGPTHVCP